MRWSNSDYEKMAKLVIDIYLDYDIKLFPVDAYDIAERMGFKVSYYSDYPKEEREAFKKLFKDGTNLPIEGDSKHTRNIIINDEIKSPARKQATIFHEIKHIVNCDKEGTQFNEDMATFFSRYMRCPTPYLICKKIESSDIIENKFEISTQMARIAASNVKFRAKKYGYKIFTYEIPLIKQLLGKEYDERTIEIIDTEEEK